MTANKKIKIVTLGDHPFSPSGVGTQTKYFIEGLLSTGKYQFISIGGAVKHVNYEPVRTEKYGDDWVIYPVDGYGSKDFLRGLVRTERPDIIWFMTDPRFWGWLWEIENEIRETVPMVYYHVWDNYPYPVFNKKYYESNDMVVTISKLTDDIVRSVAPDVRCERVGHAVPPEFKPLEDRHVKQLRQESLGAKVDNAEERVVFFWNNRNARRKQSGSLIYWFKTFLDKVGHDKATLIMHTDPGDMHGQDLEYLLRTLKLDNGQVLLSKEKLPSEMLAGIYNLVDCTINISDAEGFGLATLESLACGTPIIVNMTGGLQEQVTDGTNWFGIGVEPTSKAIIGSQEIPMIYEDRLSEEVVVEALLEMFNKTPEERAALGAAGREHVLKNYNFEANAERWDKLMTELVESCGSWGTRKNYRPWRFEKMAGVAA